jgi:N-acetylglucosaminyldiphosphoundecaprenol N-acetyl-beta-D-mannosaminyltransferase
MFMSEILPFLDQGVMFGIGAAFDFYIGKLKVPRIRIGSLRFIWLNRLFNEPSKLIKRLIPYISIMPHLYLKERKNRRQNSKYL